MTLDLASDQDIITYDFGEDAVARPIGVATRNIKVNVHRDEPVEQPDGGARARRCRIEIKNSLTKGMTPDELLQEADGDVPKIDFYESVGDTAMITEKPINRVIRQNAGMVMVEVFL